MTELLHRSRVPVHQPERKLVPALLVTLKAEQGLLQFLRLEQLLVGFLVLVLLEEVLRLWLGLWLILKAVLVLVLELLQPLVLEQVLVPALWLALVLERVTQGPYSPPGHPYFLPCSSSFWPWPLEIQRSTA